MTPALLRALAARREAGMVSVLAIRLADGAQWLLPDGHAPAPVSEAAAAALDRGRAGVVEIDGAEWFLDLHLPPARLLIVGAVHVAQALAPLARPSGFSPVVIDPRPALATAERFPGIALDHRWPDEAIRAAAPDRETAIVALTHDPKFDDPVLLAALGTPAFYLGVLGSRRTHAARLERLAALGADPAALVRLRGPAGLAIGAATPAEIALSILAEIVAVRRGAVLGRRALA